MRSSSAATTALPPPRREARRSQAAIRRTSTSLFVPLFILSLAIPILFWIGPIRLSPYRLILIATFIPLFLAWMSGGMGKVRAPDVLILVSALWSMLVLHVHHGPAMAWQPAGILLIETFGAYLLGRKLIRNQQDFHRMSKVLFWMVCALLPFAVFESMTDRAIILELIGKFAPTFGNTPAEPRYGLERAQVVFEHPILYGIFVTSAFGLVCYGQAGGKSVFGRLWRAVIVIVAGIMSVSSGAVAAVMSQSWFIGWDYVTRTVRHRWRILALLVLAAYIVVDLYSNRTPFHVFVTYLTLDVETAYGRIMIFEWGKAEVMRHPIFGIGLGDWERPSYKSASIDNFWLVVAMRYGLPAFVCLAGAVALIVKALGQVKLDDEQIRASRSGLLVTLGGLILAGATVHYWNAIYVWFMFLLGSGLWMLDAEPSQPTAKARPARGARARRQTSVSKP